VNVVAMAVAVALAAQWDISPGRFALLMVLIGTTGMRIGFVRGWTLGVKAVVERLMTGR
jgi:hypothetical protein